MPSSWALPLIAWVPQQQPKEAKVDLHVTMLLNWFD
jgi:hypothetical protein